MSGYDLDLPEDEQRRGRQFSHVGHGGVDLAAPRGTDVHVVALEHQEGDAEVIFVGKLFGTSVVTKHTLREGGRLRDYIVLYGHLDRTADGLPSDHPAIADGSVVGYVGDTGSVGVVHLHLEVRRVRDGVDVRKVPPERLVANEVSIVCDPRNVLPLK
jgi:murein DD-endopeptidase MepM/ murein hydrolase activator NlpD